jgi:hypothetical protein
VRQQFRHLRAALAVAGKLIGAARERHLPADEREPPALEQFFRARLAVMLHQRRLRIEQVEVRRGADHVQVDHPLRPRRRVRAARRKRVRRRVGRRRGRGDGVSGRRRADALAAEQRAQGNGPQAEAGALEQLAPAHAQPLLLPGVRHGVILS